MSNSTAVTSDADLRVANVESKLEDAIELLHLWKNEAYAYRHLVEAILLGRFTHDEAKKALSKSYCLNGHGMDALVSLALEKGEHDAFMAMANCAQLEPEEFLWSCLDAIMNRSGEEGVLSGCREAAEKRFKGYVLPDWSVRDG